MARKIYTSEFKEQAIKLSYSNGKPVAETAADLGLPTNMLHRWRREAKQAGRAFTGHGKPRDEELAELKKRLKQAELSETFKKAVSFFCSTTEVKYAFIKSCAEQLPVDGLCRYLEVARSGYYAWLKAAPSQRAKINTSARTAD